MANIRIAQQLSDGYNPDGTPGTVTTGTPGPGPTDDQLVAAVEMYLMAHPISGGMGSNMGVDTAPLTKHGAGADGSTGAWVGVGDNNSTVNGYVVAGGSMPDVDLHLQAQGNGRIFLDSPLVSAMLHRDDGTQVSLDLLADAPVQAAAAIEAANTALATATTASSTASGQQAAVDSAVQAAADAKTAATTAQTTAATAQTAANTAQTAANTAQARADAAFTNAGTALTAANGKNRIFTQATKPTGSFITGDMWIDTANGRRVSAYDATLATPDFVVQQFGNLAIAPGTLVASDVLVQGTVTAALIKGDAIDGKTITGAIIQTSAGTGQRLVLGNGGLIGYDSTNTAKTTISTADGTLTATGATITGNITATSGTFTGTINATAGTFSGALLIGSGNSVVKANGTDGLYVGNAAVASAPFRVGLDGSLTATNATISGAITATSGSFTGTLQTGVSGQQRVMIANVGSGGAAVLRWEDGNANDSYAQVWIKTGTPSSPTGGGQFFLEGGNYWTGTGTTKVAAPTVGLSSDKVGAGTSYPTVTQAVGGFAGIFSLSNAKVVDLGYITDTQVTNLYGYTSIKSGGGSNTIASLTSAESGVPLRIGADIVNPTGIGYPQALLDATQLIARTWDVPSQSWLRSGYTITASTVTLPTAQLKLLSTGDVSVTGTTHPFQIGPDPVNPTTTDYYQTIWDDNEMAARMWNHTLNSGAGGWQASFFGATVSTFGITGALTVSGNLTVSGTINGADTAWRNATLQNSWTTYTANTSYAVPRYRLLSNGQVEVQGLTANGVIGTDTPVFTLPAGYRPGKRLMFATIGNNAIARVDVNTNGVVSVVVGSTAQFTSFGFTFTQEL